MSQAPWRFGKRYDGWLAYVALSLLKISPNIQRRWSLALRINGACHCGEIVYEARVDPGRTIICHCTDCQTMSGAPYRVNVPAATSELKITGTPRIYEKTGGSGEAVRTAFCGTCGAALYSCKGETPAFVFLRTGAIRQRAQLAPKGQGFCGSAMPWAADLTAIPVIPAP